MAEDISPHENFIENVGLIFEEMGLGRTPGRIIGALMVNDPPYMNMNELVDKTTMSKGSISNGLNMLTGIGWVEKFSIPSERPDYYRLDNEFWKKTVINKMTALTGLKTSISKAISLIEAKEVDNHPERTNTLREMRDMYQFFEDKLPELFDEWEKQRNEKYGE